MHALFIRPPVCTSPHQPVRPRSHRCVPNAPPHPTRPRTACSAAGKGSIEAPQGAPHKWRFDALPSRAPNTIRPRSNNRTTATYLSLTRPQEQRAAAAAGGSVQLRFLCATSRAGSEVQTYTYMRGGAQRKRRRKCGVVGMRVQAGPSGRSIYMHIPRREKKSKGVSCVWCGPKRKHERKWHMARNLLNLRVIQLERHPYSGGV